ncbi:MAG: DUF2723 domain-containing protein, partial [Elusimicrobiota bacterium]|nr:DUF2723 domain-containing protein [Elusimicrobiota bacterium]
MVTKCILFLVSFGVYLATLSPTISTGDSGELCACSVILGIVHSPGYPLYCLIGKIFTVVVPFGNLAFRINLLSALFAALTVLFLYSIVESLLVANFNTISKISAILSSLLLAFTKSFWKAAVQAEVFTLNAFFA